MSAALGGDTRYPDENWPDSELTVKQSRLPQSPLRRQLVGLQNPTSLLAVCSWRSCQSYPDCHASIDEMSE